MSNTMKTIDKVLGKRQLQEAIEDAWYSAPSANAGFGRIMAILDVQFKVREQALSTMLSEIIGKDWQPHCDEYDNVNSRDISCTTCWNRLQRNVQIYEERKRATDRGFKMGVSND